MKKFDVILVLGVSTNKNLYSKRAEKAVTLYKKGLADRVIFSGRWWGGLRKKPQKTEASLMAKHAVSKGLPRKSIFLEKRSLNTAGNFYFTKRLILEPKSMFRILIVTSGPHIPKAKYLARKILGPKYTLKFLSDNQNISSITKGHSSIKEIGKYFNNIKEGDNRVIWNLFKKHPHYKLYRKP